MATFLHYNLSPHFDFYVCFIKDVIDFVVYCFSLRHCFISSNAMIVVWVSPCHIVRSVEQSFKKAQTSAPNVELP